MLKKYTLTWTTCKLYEIHTFTVPPCQGMCSLYYLLFLSTMNKFKRLTLLYIKRLAGIRKNFIRSNSSQSNSGNLSHYALLTIPATSFALGTWQVQRLEWKKGLIRDLEAKTQGHIIPLPENILDPGKIKELEYRRVFVEGKFDHTKEIFLGPRPLTKSGPHTGGGMMTIGSKTGFQIITPFILTSGERILINRGWVPVEKKNPKTRLDGQIDDTVQIAGLLRSNEKRPRFTPKVKEDGYDWHYRDIGQFMSLLNTLPVLIDADATSTVKGGPIGGQTHVHIRNEHMQYIITWYSLAAATLLMYYQFRKNPGAMFRGGPMIKE